LSGYADTSFLVSLYTPDANSAQAASLMAAATLPVMLTPLGELELTNAFELRRFRRELDSSEVAASRAAFRRDVENGIFAIVPLPANVFERAKLRARKRTSRLGTHSLDILHVASAVALKSTAFYSFDRNQGKLAKTEGLNTLP
jgi:predicted nucleic acid-binding protein